MTYLQYHLLFIVPVLAGLLWLTARRRGALAGALTPSDRWTRGWLRRPTSKAPRTIRGGSSR